VAAAAMTPSAAVTAARASWAVTRPVRLLVVLMAAAA